MKPGAVEPAGHHRRAAAFRASLQYPEPRASVCIVIDRTVNASSAATAS
jgi:hypothetical protein